jgi:hypothetical protein
MNHIDAGAEVVKALPPILVTGAITIGGIELHNWVLFATLAYTILQTVLLVLKLFRPSKGGSDEH